MKRISKNIWSDTVDGIQIVVNENANTIGAVMPNGRPVVVPYQATPTIDQFIRFRDAVIEAAKVFRTLKIS